MRIFDKVINKAEKETFKVKSATFPDGTPISHTVKVVNGKYDGPRIALLGVQHGDEYSGMEIINRLFESIKAKELTGTIISIPVSNPLAFNTASRITPPNVGYENLNMNRVWPGNSKGLLVERIVSNLWENIVVDSDIVIDLHEGGKVFMARYIHARGTPETNKIVGEKVQDLYTWFGQGIPVLGGIRTRTHMLGGLSVQAGLQGIPCISPELGGGGRLWEHLIITGVKGVRNILIMKDMIQDEPFGLEMKQYVAQESIWPKTCEGGFMYNSCELGDIVEKNECLGILKNVGGEFLEEINAPYKSIIFDTRFLPTVYPGDWTFHCGKID